MRRQGTKTILAAALSLVVTGLVLAQLVVTGSITGNTINYSVIGASPDSDYHVVLHNDSNNQGNTYGEHSNDKGEFSGSGTAGGEPLENGDTVTITVFDENDNPVGSTTIKNGEDAPWWAYTGVGTVVYFVF